MKLFVIDMWNGTVWVPGVLYKGCFQDADDYTKDVSLRTRVRRVKTPAELEQYDSLSMIGPNSSVDPEWVN